MTEQEWLEGTDPTPMLGLVRSKSSDRKLRLIATAACRRVWHLFEDRRSQQGIESAELHADGFIDDIQLDAALTEAWRAYDDAEGRTDERETFVPRCLLARAVQSVTQPPSSEHVPYDGWEALSVIAEALAILRPDSAIERAPYVEGDIIFESGRVFTEALSLEEQTAQATLIRDIFGNPFRPVTLDPRWQSSTVLDLARTIYEQRTFEHLPILADALMDAGCDSEEVIQHCQGPGPHVRGCWVVDLLLGRE